MAILNVDAAVTRLSQVPSCFRILPAAASATTVHTTSAWAAENDKAEHSAAKTAVRFNMVAILIQHPNGLTARPSSAMTAAVPLARPADRRRLAGLLGSPARSCVRTPASFRHARSAGFQLRAENAAPEQEAGQMRKHQSLFAAAAFGGLSGGRTAMGPALLALEKKQRKRVFGARRIGRGARTLEAVAAAGLGADKRPLTPSRTRPL